MMYGMGDAGRIEQGMMETIGILRRMKNKFR